ncbi:hypothetical protein TNCV_4550841 [Trichonephila clavipes]|uniref:Uncharacterized protein n=1 Tax=Trichonephila clavipes TaxID=2585209 RepID=A0A8X6S6G0_TRICX|nr:hypothetical protein TNCV_4550841 [Trichonephila clavipes]
MPVRTSSVKFPEGAIDGDTTFLLLNNLCIELNGREIFFSTLHSLFSPQDLTSTYSVFTRRVCIEYASTASSMEPSPSGLKSDALTIRIPTAPTQDS